MKYLNPPVGRNVIFNELYTIGFKPYVPMSICSPIVTTYKIPKYIKEFDFDKYSKMLREQNIVLYPSPLNNKRVIRVGNIGDIFLCFSVKCISILYL